jgi:integrase
MSPSTQIADFGLTRAERSRMLREMVRDKGWKKSPVGEMVLRYLRWLRNEYGATEATMRDYQSVLAQMCDLLEDRELTEVDIEDLRVVIEFWAKRSIRTRAKVTSVIRSFWAWCEEEGHVEDSPAAKIRRPRGEKKLAKPLPLDARPRLTSIQLHPRDELALYLLLDLGLRLGELQAIQFRDFDAQRGALRVQGKGRKERLLPLRGKVLDALKVALVIPLPVVDRPPRGDDYLLYPIDKRANGKGSEGQMLFAWHPRPKDKPSDRSVSRWWYRRCEEAGLVGPGVTRGLNMHRARHSFLMEMRRVAGIEAASQAAGHSELNTTLGIYGHQDESDLESAMDRFAEWRETHA